MAEQGTLSTARTHVPPAMPQMRVETLPHFPSTCPVSTERSAQQLKAQIRPFGPYAHNDQDAEEAYGPPEHDKMMQGTNLLGRSACMANLLCHAFEGSVRLVRN